MTVVVAVLNKSAVALAADSTGTIVQADGTIRRTYETTNKLFTLSKYHPVGVMIYGNLELMGVPWETIIKAFRNRLGKTSHDSLEEYKKALIGFLDGSRSLFPDKAQRFWFKVDVVAEFKRLTDDIQKAVDASKRKSESQKKRLLIERIQTRWQETENAETIDSLSVGLGRTILAKYSAEIDSAITETFGSRLWPIDDNSRKRLQQIAANLYVRKNVPDYRVPDVGGGVVVSGFGDKDPFPAVTQFNCQRIILDRLLYRDGPGYTPSFEIAPAAIIPLAQTDVVMSFLRGVDPGFQRLVEGMLSQFVQSQVNVVLDEIASFTGKPLPKARRENLKADIEKRYLESLKLCNQGLKKYTDEKHVEPLLQVLANAPKEELAVIAEALVSLTAIKRKMSLEWPTVGGPIDTAVISKGDGFIWISRKHYFDARLNPNFTQKYFED